MTTLTNKTTLYSVVFFINGFKMCKQRIVLDTIKRIKGEGEMTPVQMQLAEAQCEDYQTMKKEILEIKNDVSTLKKDNEYIKGKLDILVQQSEPKPSIFEKILNSPNAKYVFYTVIITLLILGALFGVPVTGFHGLFSLGGQ